MPSRTLVTLATYNEKENLARLVGDILEVQETCNILVIDDNSPDGTGVLADQLHDQDPRVLVLHREGKLGLGTATLAAMKFAIENEYDYMLNMDADFSHNPKYIPDLIQGMDNADVMIGSRYVPGGGVPDWPFHRRLMSTAINTYARLLLGLKVRDTSGAFRCYSISKLSSLDLNRIISRGYSFQEEILYWCKRAGCTMTETPIIFEDRRYGQSKINKREAINALVILLRIGVLRLWPFS